MGLLSAVAIMVSVLLTLQSAFALFLMLYTWDQLHVQAMARAPEHFLPPQKSFTVMLPARHEEEVIQTTIERVMRAHYPLHLLEVVVICSADDIGTIARANEKMELLRRDGITNLQVAIFSDGPINKPHGLNVGLRSTHHEVVTIVDAEDDIHPGIFNVVNTVMLNEQVSVVQCGVQLMNYQSSWYSALNVLEYFFWFKSRLHYHSRLGAIPLGGNTVFFERIMIAKLGGWDEKNLTEDAEIGLRLSAAGERIRVVYDDRYVTKEETPPTLSAFIRQRTRWSQGFLQTFNKGIWRQLPTRKQRWLAGYTLAFPQGQALLGIYIPLSLLMMVAFKTPVLIALISYVPVAMFLAHFLTAVVGLYEFTGAHGLRATPKAGFSLAIAWLPYQMVICYAALRPVQRQWQGVINWAK